MLNRIINASRSRIIRDSFWALYGNVLAKGMALAAGIIVARILGKDVYGEYGIIKNTLLSMAIFSTFGLGYTSTKFISEYKTKEPLTIKYICSYVVSITLIVSCSLAFALFVSANYFADVLLEAPHLTMPLRIVAVWIVFNALTTTQIGLLAGFGEFKKIVRINAVVGIVTFIASFLFTTYWALNGSLYALLLSQALNVYLNNRLLKKLTYGYGRGVTKKRSLVKDLMKFTLPVSLQETVFSISYWLTSIVLMRFSSYGEVGLYTAAMQWNAIVLFVPSILRNVVLSHLSNTNNDVNNHWLIVRTTLVVNFVVTFVPFVIVFFMSNFIANFYGDTFDGLGSVIKYSVLAAVFMSLGNVYTQAYMSKNKNWIMFFMRFIRDVGYVIITYVILVLTSGKSGSFSVFYSLLFVNIVFFIAMAFFYHVNYRNA